MDPPADTLVSSLPVCQLEDKFPLQATDMSPSDVADVNCDETDSCDKQGKRPKRMKKGSRQHDSEFMRKYLEERKEESARRWEKVESGP